MDWAFWVLLIMFFVYVIADRAQEKMRKRNNESIQINKFLCADIGHSFGKNGKDREDLYWVLAKIIGENEDAYKIMKGGDILEKVQSNPDMVH